MAEPIYQRGAESSIPSSDRQSLVDYAEGLISELPEACASCPAAYICAVALNEDEGYGFPRTPRDVRNMKFRHGESGSYSMPSGQAQFALKSIAHRANETNGTGPSQDGTSCCLDANTSININKTDLYR